MELHKYINILIVQLSSDDSCLWVILASCLCIQFVHINNLICYVLGPLYRDHTLLFNAVTSVNIYVMVVMVSNPQPI